MCVCVGGGGGGEGGSDGKEGVLEYFLKTKYLSLDMKESNKFAQKGLLKNYLASKFSKK